MTQDQKFLAIGVYLHGGLYLVAVYISALAASNLRVRNLSISAMGLTWAGYFLQLTEAPRDAQLFVVAVSILLGLAAGFLLMVT